MAYKARWVSLLFFILLFLSAGATLESKPSEVWSGEDVIPKEVACSFRGEDFYNFLVDKIAEKVDGNINEEKLETLKVKIFNSSLMATNPSWNELVDSRFRGNDTSVIPAKDVISAKDVIPAKAGIQCMFSEGSCFRRNDTVRVKKTIEDEMKSKDSIELKYSKLAILKMVLDGETFKINVCGMESRLVKYEDDTLFLDLNEFRTTYHRLWLTDLYLWFKNRHPNLDQKLYEEAHIWKAQMPIFVEGATGDKADDDRRKSDTYSSTKRERLERITSEFARKSVRWFVIDWSKSTVAIDGKASHPSIINEHKNFAAQFLGAVELVHLMSIAEATGNPLQVVAFSAGTNVVLMASEIYKGLGKSGATFKNVILVQGSIYHGRDLTPLVELTSQKGRVIVTRNREDAFYLGAGTKSIGFAGGLELFGKGESIGFRGASGESLGKRVEVWDIYQEPEITRGRKPLLHSEFKDSKYTDGVEGEHWRWFSPYNFRRLIKLFYF